ncbi:PglL family O-oligosaccharyltransferase [Pseudorhodoferax soli]|uniref:O-antigen ligase n=1 Tax=Pseudorhodoferax soli TaxID=545864 RepID=A0A368XEJ4_9BURK|nr:O-antigen ligase family protein [Pseudorhodoferax soli]RCW65636.1 O-antigen ligase [Pseudorhodoferax soli]
MSVALALAGIGFLLSWLLPNHYAPWASFWQDVSAALGLMALWALSILCSARNIRVSWLSLGAALVAVVPLIQWACGQVYFFGDAVIVCLYLIGFSLAVATPTFSPAEAELIIEPLVIACIAACVLSVGLAISQWLNIGRTSIFFVDMPPNARPYANLAQPNQLATLLLLGVVGALWSLQKEWIGRFGAGLAIAWFCFGIAVTQSRSAWAGMAVLVIWLLVVQRRANIKIGRVAIAVVGGHFFLFVLAWPTLCDWLFLSANRSLADQAKAGVRVPLWAAMLDAIGREPWIGYGWNQVSVAQFKVADAHAPINQWFEDAHNLIIELFVTNGVLVGGLIAVSLTLWLWRHLYACKDAASALALGGILVVGVHAMFEFPLDYAYFLLPTGLLAGLVEGRSTPRKSIVLPRVLVIVVGVVAATLLARVVYEYLEVEKRHRDMRFEMAGFGPSFDQSNAIQLRLLTQFDEISNFAKSRAVRNMSQEQLDEMKKMAERFGFPPVLFRYALAAGLNGDPATAERTLNVLCRVHAVELCVEGVTAWHAMAQGDYPELRAVKVPDLKGEIQMTPLQIFRPSIPAPP